MVLQILFLGPSNLLEPNATFAQMSQKLIVSPIVKTLVFSKVPEKVGEGFFSFNTNFSVNEVEKQLECCLPDLILLKISGKRLD